MQIFINELKCKDEFNRTGKMQSEKIIKIIQTVIGNDTEITLDSTKENTLNWDSLNHLNLIVELEDAFDIRFSPEEMEEMVSVNSIIKIINTKHGH